MTESSTGSKNLSPAWTAHLEFPKLRIFLNILVRGHRLSAADRVSLRSASLENFAGSFPEAYEEFSALESHSSMMAKSSMG